MASTSRAEIVVCKTWRSEATSLAIFVVMSILAVFFSRVFPFSIIEGEVVTIGSTTIRLSLPLFWFVPAFTIGMAIYRIYNVRYVINERGIESEVGILALHRRLTRVWFEDVRSVQTEQSLLNRLLGVGDLEISTAATGTIEIILRGIAAPDEVQEMVQRERDKRQSSQHFAKNQQNNREELIASN